MEEKANAYSRRWFECFHVGIDEERTTREVEFVCDCAPAADFPKVLDVCCGMGRHARELSKRGYETTGIDRDPNAIAKASALGGGPNYLAADIREYRPASDFFDAALVMGQSFGHFDPATNRDVLQRLTHAVRKDGRIILDLWNPQFFKAHQGERELKTRLGIARENKRVENDRLFVQLHYTDGASEKFEWQLFTSEQMTLLADSVGLILLLACTRFDRNNPPSPDDPRVQFVLERTT